MTAYVKTDPPHIRTSQNIFERAWKTFLALLPAIGISFYFFGFTAVKVFSFCIVSVLITSLISKLLLGRKVTAIDPHDVLIAALLFLILPPTLEGWRVCLGGVAAALLGRTVWGGFGQNPFHSVLVGRILLQLCFPRHLSDALMFNHETALFFCGALLLGGVVLLILGLIYWEIPFLYAVPLMALPALTGGSWNAVTYGGLLFLVALYFVTDSVTTPLTRSGCRFFSLGASLVTLVLVQRLLYHDALGYSILIMNACVPWIDHFIRPKPQKINVAV